MADNMADMAGIDIKPHTAISKVIHAQEEILHALEDGVRVIDVPEYGSYTTFQDSQQRPIQRWVRYREGFSPILVKKLLRGDLLGGLVADPFCGSGTTLEETILHIGE
jgi:DNA modification methylase